MGPGQDATKEPAHRPDADVASRPMPHLLADAALIGQVGAWVYERSTGLVTWSKELCTALGEPAGAITALDTFVGAFSPEFRSAVAEALDKCITIGTPIDLEVPVLRRSGELEWVRLLARATVDAEGTTIGAYGVLRIAYGERTSLHESEMRLRIAQHVAQIGSWELRLADQTITWSEETYRIFGVTADEFVPTAASILALIHPDDDEAFRAHLDLVHKHELAMDVEHRIVTPSGRVRTIHALAQMVGERGDRNERLVGTVQDVTERRLLEVARRDAGLQLARMTHLYRALSEINKAIAQLPERAVLLDRICEVLVESGGFRMAWIGWHAPHRRVLEPVALYGHHTDYLDQVVVATGAGREATGPSGRAFLEDEPFISNDIQRDPMMIPWRAEALARGFLSSAAFPIHQGGVPVGVVSVYADRADFFQTREITLISEAAANISFALDNQVREEERRLLATSLATQRERLEEAQAVAHVGSWENDLRTGALQWSRETYRIFGQDAGRFQPTFESFLELIHPDDRERISGALTASIDSTQETVVEHRVVLPGGAARVVEERWRVVRDASGKPYRAIGTCVDITERHLAEAATTRLTESLTTTLESITDAFFTVDRSWRFTYLNRHVGEQLRLPMESLTGHTLWEAVPDFANSPTGVALEESMRASVPNTREHFSPRLGQWFEVRAYPSSQGLTVSLRDITDRRQSEAQLRAFALRLQSAQENERAVIARDVHDGLGQSLSVLLLDASRLAGIVSDHPETATLVAEMKALLRSTLEDSRAIARSLHPSALDDLGLTAAIEMHVAQLMRRSPLTISMELAIDDAHVDRAHAAATYRILQETLTNVLRHASATHVTLSLVEDEGMLVAEVIDDGIGIAPSAVRGANSLGMIGMRERAAALDGTVDVAPVAGGGTRVLLRIPLQSRAALGEP